MTDRNGRDISEAEIKIIKEAVDECSKRRTEWYEMKQRTKAWWLGYTSVEQMEDHLPWLETRFPEGAEL